MNLIGEISFRVFVGSLDDFLERTVNRKGEKRQNSEGKKENDQKHQVDPQEQGLPFMVEIGERPVDGNISVDGIVGCDGNHDSEHFCVKLPEKISRRIIIAAKFHRIKPLDGFVCFRIQGFLCVQQDLPVGVDQPDLGVMKRTKCGQGVVEGLESALFLVIQACLPAGDATRFPGQ